MPTEHYNATERDKTVAEKLAKLWMARQGYEAMHYNELGDFDAASRSIRQHDEAFAELVANLPQAENMIADRERLRARSSVQWDGIGKKEAMLAARKAVRLKPDLRRGHRQGRCLD